MFWIPMTLGALMFLGGAFFIIRFFVRRRRARPEVAESGTSGVVLIVSVFVHAMGALLLILGFLGVLSPEAGGG